MQPTVDSSSGSSDINSHTAAAQRSCLTTTAKAQCLVYVSAGTFSTSCVGTGTQCCAPDSVPRCWGRMLGCWGTAPLLCCPTTAPCALLRGRCSAPGLLLRHLPAWRLANSYIRSALPCPTLPGPSCPDLPCPAPPRPAPPRPALLSCSAYPFESNSGLAHAQSLHTCDQCPYSQNIGAQFDGADLYITQSGLTIWVETAVAV